MVPLTVEFTTLCLNVGVVAVSNRSVLWKNIAKKTIVKKSTKSLLKKGMPWCDEIDQHPWYSCTNVKKGTQAY